MACLEVRFHFRTVELRDLDVLGRDDVEAWVRLPDRAVLLGRRWSPEGPQIRSDDATLSIRHGEIAPRPGGFVVRDLNSSGGTFINNLRLIRDQPPHVLADGDVIYAGAPSSSAALTFHDTEPGFACDDVERELAMAVRAGLEGSHDVYADWLEERGDLVRATFLRDRHALAQPLEARVRYEQMRRCVQAIDTVDAGWRLLVLGMEIGN